MQSFMALLIGFAVAGLISTGYQALTQRPASFRLLERGPKPSTFAAIPFLAFAAPFIIMRNTIRGRRIEGRRFELVTIATVIAGITKSPHPLAQLRDQPANARLDFAPLAEPVAREAHRDVGVGIREPVSTPDQVRGQASRGHAPAGARECRSTNSMG